MRPGDSIGEGDSEVLYDSLKGIHSHNDCDNELFSGLKNEIYWQKMSHRAGEVPRLVSCQGDVLEGGATPIYRHPTDEILPLMRWSPLVKRVRDRVQGLVKHPMNHCLIQLYRSGNDYISEHSDKTLDIVRGSYIVNVSLGAQRTMRLRTKKTKTNEENDESVNRRSQLVPLPHGSVLILGQKSNMAWLHGINADKRPLWELSDAEKAYGGERISLTFRRIGTYLDARQTSIWGQGARAKSQENAHYVINGVEEQNQQLIRAFGQENHDPLFDWDAIYGHGFDVLNYSAAKSMPEPVLFLSGHEEVDARVQTLLKFRGWSFKVCGVPDAGRDYRPVVCLRDVDSSHTEVRGEGEIKNYLNVSFT